MRSISPEAIFLNPEHSPTLQGQLIVAMTQLLRQRRYPPGTRLPSTRALAHHLGVSRLTVTLVYDQLVSQGYINAARGSGYFVADDPLGHAPTTPEESGTTASAAPDWSGWLSRYPPPRRAIRKPRDWRHYRYPFIYGQADAQFFDHAAWRDCAREALGLRDFYDLAADKYGLDDESLVDSVRRCILPRRGISATPEQVLMTIGAQNALFLAVHLLAGADRLIVMEDPGYPDFAEIARRSASPLAFVPSDENGLDPDRLPPGTRLVMVTPSHNIPTGATMPRHRRQRLLERAEIEDFLIIEDDYEFEMSFLARPEPALKSLDRTGRVIYVGSFSKSLFPGLRLGYIVADAALIARARLLRFEMYRQPAGYLQRVISYFLGYGHYDAHIARMKREFAARREVLVEALGNTPLRIAGASRQGGSSLWIAAPEGTDSRRLAQALEPRSVLIEPGDVFFETAPPVCPYLRLGYSSISAQNIPQGIAIIAEQLARQTA